jgi:small conductance mechanosensitive channel
VDSVLALAGLLPAAAIPMLPFAGSSGRSAAELAACGNKPSDVCLAVLKLTGNGDLAKTLGTVAIPISIAFIAIVAIIIRYLIVFTLNRAVRRTVHGSGLLNRVIPGRAREKLAETSPLASARRQQRAETIGSVLRSVTSVFVYGIAVIEILGVVGIDLAPIIAGAGIVGVAVAFGAQNLVSDFLSGVFMVLEDQYGVGDLVDVGPAIGTVEGVSLRVTRVRDLNGTLWHVRNGQIQQIGNMSQNWARSVIFVTIAYDQPIDEAETLIKQAADSVWHDEKLGRLLLDEPELSGVQEVTADSIVIRLLIKTVPGEQWGIERELRKRIKQAFDAAGIRFPFPQQTVWLRAPDGPPGAGPAGTDGHRRTAAREEARS